MSINDGVSFGRVGAFRFWCQKVLPAVYDDSLSYYELLCKVIKYLNDVIKLTNTQSDAITELQETLAKFMEGTFDPYIEEKIDKWFEENEPEITQQIADLEEIVNIHVDGVTVTPILLGTMVFSTTNNMYGHPGGVCSNGEREYLFIQPEPYTNTSYLTNFSIKSNEWTQQKTTGTMAHCNSAAYNPHNDKIYVAPVFDYSNDSQTPTNYIKSCNTSGGGEETILFPEWIAAVSYDWAKDKLYALAFTGNVYEINTVSNTYEVAYTINRPYHFNQDFAVYNGYYVLCKPEGYCLCGNLGDDEQKLFFVNNIDHTYLFNWGELDSIEFNPTGNLLAICHSNSDGERLGFIYELPINNKIPQMFDYAVEKSWATGATYSIYVKQDSTKIKNNGFSADGALQSLNFVNALVDDIQRSMILLSDYSCENLRIGNDSYDWVSLNGHTLEITGTLTVQTRITFNGGYLKLSNPIYIAYGDATFGFSGNIHISISGGTSLLASIPVGTYVYFGGDVVIETQDLKLHSSMRETIAPRQVYILGTILSS